MAAQHPARASPELRMAPLSPRYRRNYTTPGGTINTVDLVVAGYFDLWKQYLAGQSPVKLQMYRGLSERSGRSIKSIERKSQNISAVLERLGLPWIPGLAPLRNYQGILVNAVALRVGEIWNFEPKVETQQLGMAESAILFLEQAPPKEGLVTTKNEELERLARKFDPALRDLRNRRTGHVGEELVYRSEIVKLRKAGRDDLAKKDKWVSRQGSPPPTLILGEPRTSPLPERAVQRR